MKLDLNACWDQAMRLIGLNREVMLVLGGVFFFLPYAVFRMAIPQQAFDLMAAAASQGDSAAMWAAMRGFIDQYWWAMLLVALVQTLGALAIMAIAGDPKRPTVGTAVRRAARLLPSAAGAQVIATFGALALAMLVLILGALTGSIPVSATLMLMTLPLLVWFFTRLSLASAAIAIEERVNPLAALRRSWRMTAGNGLRLSVFYLLLAIAYVVIAQVVGLIVRLVTALPGAQTADILDAVLSGAVSSVVMVIFYAVLASVHRQLARAERTSLDPDVFA